MNAYCSQLPRSTLPIYSWLLAIENYLLPRESAMISAVLKNVLRFEREKMFSDFWREMSSERT